MAVMGCLTVAAQDQKGITLSGSIQSDVLLPKNDKETGAEKTEDFGDFLAFEPLTLFPYDLQLIDRTMLTNEEVAQINDYHRMVRERITPLLNAEEAAWLADKTKELN